eukprot:m.199465 g.199465  ORF g.199465 m.199465 type:complete len:726 (+) comp14947_c0_seq1:78-2255(+)
MSKHARKSGPSTLADLQNLCKRDPQAYAEEFHQQYLHYQSALDIFKLNPSQANDEFGELVSFLGAVATCYSDQLKAFPGEIAALLDEHAPQLDPKLRHTLCRTLMLVRNKGLLTSSALLQLFFKLFRVPDKLLRETLYRHIVNDIRKLNQKHRNNAVNKALQNFMFTMLQDSNLIAAKKSLDCMIELYIKGVWRDVKTVNVIITACFSPHSKLLATALRFFLKTNDELEDEVHSDEEDVDANATYQSQMQANSRNKKTAKRKKQLQKALKVMKKQEKKKTQAQAFNFAALHDIHDPQTVAEKMFARLRKAKTERFEVKMMMINFISRLIGIHELILLNFYPFLQGYLKPHQSDVTMLLTYLAQAAHPLVPADALESVLLTIANNFVSERSSPESIAVGLNSIREICTRCPLAMTEALLGDLVQYRSHKHKSVVMASRSLIQAFRELNPSILPKKERGRPTGEATEALQYGQSQVATIVPGAELLSMYTEAVEAGELVDEDDGWEVASDEDSEDELGDWVTVAQDDKELAVAPPKRAKKGPRARRMRLEAIKRGEDPDALFDDDDEVEGAAAAESSEFSTTIQDSVSKEERLKRAMKLSSTKILTQEDFDKIRELQAKKLLKPSLSTRQVVAEDRMVELDDILPDRKKAHQSKEERLASVMAGREGRGKFGGRKEKMSEFASTSNKDKAKRKHPVMLKAARAYRSKKKLSMMQRQMLKQQAKKKRK